MSTKDKKKLEENAYKRYIKDNEYFIKRIKMLIDKLYKKENLNNNLSD